jgi:hypothetical protein
MKKFWLMALICSAWQDTRAHAQDATVVVDGTTYTAYVRGGEAAVVTGPLSASLTRDGSRRVPGCADVERNLARLAAEIEGCRKLTQASNLCGYVRTLVDHVRFVPSTIGVNELEQRWTVTPRPSTPSDVSAVVAAAARATKLQPSAVRYLENPQPVTGIAELEVVVTPNGKSWASKLLGLVDWNEKPPVTANDGSVITRDHVLACGLQAGEVSLMWEQMTSLTHWPVLLTEDQSWALYQELAESASVQSSTDNELRELQVGAAIGRALSELMIAPNDDAMFDATVRLAFAAFFDLGTLEFAQGLSEAEVRMLVHSAAFEYPMPWSGNVPTF